MLLPEPTYKGPESIVYFRGNSIHEELMRDTKVKFIDKKVTKTFIVQNTNYLKYGKE